MERDFVRIYGIMTPENVDGKIATGELYHIFKVLGVHFLFQPSPA